MTTSSNPLVSIVMPCYNAAQWLSEAVESCLSQTYESIEIIIIDDGSTDSSFDIIQSYATNYPSQVRFAKYENSGASAARNRGYALARGKYIKFLDADDTILPSTIAGEIATLGGRTDVIASCPWWSLEWTGQEWHRHYPQPYQLQDRLASELRYGDFIPGQALLWPSEILRKLGGWDETRCPNDDGDLRLRALLAGYPIVLSELGGFQWRHHSATSLSRTQSDQALASIIRVFEKVEANLLSTNRLELYKLDLARTFHRLASSIMPYNELFGDVALSHAKRLGGYRSVEGTIQHHILCYTIGLKRKERLARRIRHSRFSRILGRTRKLRQLTEFTPPT